MEEKRLECLTMLQIHRSVALMQLLTDLPPLQRRLNFLPRDAMRSAVFAVARCPSVRPSVTLALVPSSKGTYCFHCIYFMDMHCVIQLGLYKLLKQINVILIEPFQRGAKYTGMGNFAIFDWDRRLSWKQYEMGPSCYGTLIGNIDGGSIRVGSDDLEWLWKTGCQESNFQSDLLNNAGTVWCRTTKFGRITNMGRGVFLGGQPRHCFCTNV